MEFNRPLLIYEGGGITSGGTNREIDPLSRYASKDILDKLDPETRTFLTQWAEIRSSYTSGNIDYVAFREQANDLLDKNEDRLDIPVVKELYSAIRDRTEKTSTINIRK